MLNEFQSKRVWENLLASEARSLYFAELASTYTLRKQIITGITFFLSSGAAAAIVANLAHWIPLVLSTVVAITSAYSIAIGLDRRIGTMSKLHSMWSQISSEYDHLWSHQADDDAEQQLEQIIRHEKEPSELATTEAPYNPRLMEKWQEHVFSMYRPVEEQARA